MRYLVARSHPIGFKTPVVEVVREWDFGPDLLVSPPIEKIEAETARKAYKKYIKKHGLQDTPFINDY